MCRRRTALLPVILGLGAATGTVQAQELDAGQLEVRENGRRVAIERYRVWRTGSTVNAVASVQRPQEEELQVRLRMDPALLPMKYELRAGRTSVISGERFADRVRVHSVSPEGERWKEYPARGVGAILETGVTHHLMLLLHVLRDAPGRQASVLVPGEGRTMVARLVDQNPERVSLGEGSVTATRYEVEANGERYSIWLDTDDKLLRVLDPQNSREAVRVPSDG